MFMDKIFIQADSPCQITVIFLQKYRCPLRKWEASHVANDVLLSAYRTTRLHVSRFREISDASLLAT